MSKPSWGIFWRLRGIVVDIEKVLTKTIPTIQADIKDIKTNHIKHLEEDVSEVKTGVRQIKRHLGIPDEPA